MTIGLKPQGGDGNIFEVANSGWATLPSPIFPRSAHTDCEDITTASGHVSKIWSRCRYYRQPSSIGGLTTPIFSSLRWNRSSPALKQLAMR